MSWELSRIQSGGNLSGSNELQTYRDPKLPSDCTTSGHKEIPQMSYMTPWHVMHESCCKDVRMVGETREKY